MVGCRHRHRGEGLLRERHQDVHLHRRQHLGCLHQQNHRGDPHHQDVDRPWVGDLGRRVVHLGHPGEGLDRRDVHLDHRGERRLLGCRDLLVAKDVKSLVVAEWADPRQTTDAERLVEVEWGDRLGQRGQRGAEAFRVEVFRAYVWAACPVDAVLFHLAQVVALQRWG